MKIFLSVFFAILAAAAVIFVAVGVMDAQQSSINEEVKFQRLIAKTAIEGIGYTTKDKYIADLNDSLIHMQKSSAAKFLAGDIQDMRERINHAGDLDPNDSALFKRK